MLQACNGNFLFTDDVYRTTHRAPLYTNLSFPNGKIELSIGTLTTTSYFLPLTTLIAEIEEKQPATDSRGEKSIFIATTGNDIMNDLSIVISFFFKGYCTTSFMMAKQLLSDEVVPNTTRKLSDFVEHFFNKRKIVTQEEVDNFIAFFNKLLSLPRNNYITVIKAIRRYTTALVRISDDLDAAYALFVASIESLTQDLSGYETNWKDLDTSKRIGLDKILANIDSKNAEEIRLEILKHEHLGLSRKFCGLVMGSLDKSFYKPRDGVKVAGINELKIAVRNAYNLRSKYVHVLSLLSDKITMPYNHNYCVDIDGKPHLTFNGLSVVNHQVLIKYVEDCPVGGKESLNAHEYIPGIIMAKVSEVHWMGNAISLNKKNYLLYLDAILSRIEHIASGGKAEIPNMGAVVDKIEDLISTENNKECLMILFSMLVLLSYYFGFTATPKHSDKIKKCEELFNESHIYTLLLNTLCDVRLENPKELYDKFNEYQESKYHKNRLRLSEFYESLLCANLINHLKEDNEDKLAHELVDYILYNTPNSIVRKSLIDDVAIDKFDIRHLLTFQIAKTEN